MNYDFLSRGQFIIALNFLLLPILIGPWFENFFRGPKWVLLYFSSLFLIPFIKSVPKVKISKSFLVLFLLVMIYHREAPLSPFLLDLFCFITITLAVYGIAKRSPDLFLKQVLKFNIPATILVLSVSYLQLFQIPLPSWFALFPVGNFTSFFGNTIFTGEFLASSILLLLYGWESSGKKLNLVLIFLSLTLIYFLFSRMVIIGIVLAYFIPRWGKKLPLKMLIPLFLILGALTIGGIRSPLFSKGILKSKASSFDQRWALVLNSLSMIKDRPFFGIGPLRFPTSYIPYRNAKVHDPFVKEHRWRDDPHSTPIRLMVEFGVPFALICLFLWFKMIWRKWEVDPLNRFLLGILIFYSVDLLFGFPWMLPYPFFFCAVCLGIGLSKKEVITLKKPLRNFALVCSFLLLGFRSLSYSFSRFAIKNYSSDFSKMGQACKLTPYIWENCYQRVKKAYRYGKYNEVIEISRKMEALYPGHHTFIKSSALALVKTRKLQKACQQMRNYENIVGSPNSLENLKRNYCKN